MKILRNITLYVSSFAGFFRFGEGFMVIKVLKSKNDQLRRGDEVVISALSSCACPVKLLKRYLSKFQIPPDSRCLIFGPISRRKGSCKLVSPDKRISYGTMREAFRRDYIYINTHNSSPSTLWWKAYRNSLHQ